MQVVSQKMFLSLDHNPIPQKRPRFWIKGGKPMVYDSQASEKLKLKFKFASQMRAKGYLIAREGPIAIKVIAYLRPPSKWSRKRLKEAEGSFVITKPDSDNILKFYFDVLTGIAYHDDNQICFVLCKKLYSETARVEITIKKLDYGEEHENEINI